MRTQFVLIIVLTSLFSPYIMAQDRVNLKGQVLYRGSNVVNETVINTSTEEATITDEDGRYTIPVAIGDELVFTAVNYQLKIVKITEEILANKRLVVEVTEKVTELDEVVVSPENQEEFLALKNERFKKFEYETDRATEVQNISTLSDNDRIEGQLNFVNIFRALFKAKDKDTGEPINFKLSEVLRQVYDDEFFILDLGLASSQINAFLFYCDDKVPSQSLLKKENEFQLIDFLVTQSKAFKEEE